MATETNTNRNWLTFLDPNGKELWRHVGFFSKEEILEKWKELGYDLKTKEEKALIGNP